MGKNSRMFQYNSNICGIYSIKNKVTGEMYIGQSTNIHNRWNRHIRDAKADVKSPLPIAILKYGVCNFEFSIIKNINIPDSKMRQILLHSYEKFYISKYNTVHSGYNLTFGGNTNLVFADKSIKRMRDAQAVLSANKSEKAKNDADVRRIARITEYINVEKEYPNDWVNIIVNKYNIRRKSLRIFIKNHIPELIGSYTNSIANSTHTLLMIEEIRKDNPSTWVGVVNDLIFKESPRGLYRFLKKNKLNELYKEYRYQIYNKEI